MTKSCNGKRCTESCEDIDQSSVARTSGSAGPSAKVTGYEFATTPCYGSSRSSIATAPAILVHSAYAILLLIILLDSYCVLLYSHPYSFMPLYSKHFNCKRGYN
jgi:hypothetical protein